MPCATAKSKVLHMTNVLVQFLETIHSTESKAESHRKLVVVVVCFIYLMV